MARFGDYKFQHWQKSVWAKSKPITFCVACGARLIAKKHNKPKKHCGTKECKAEYMRQLWANESFKTKTAMKIREAHIRPEVKEHVVSAKRAHWRRQDYREKISRINSRRWDDPQKREKMIEAMRMANSSPEVKHKRSENSKALWRNEQFRRDILPKLRLASVNGMAKSHKRGTSIELRVWAWLDEMGVVYKKNHPVEGVCLPDAVVMDRKAAIFCDGDYWHNRKGVQERDANINRKLLGLGWRVLRLWEHEIRDNSIDCIHRMKDILNG